MDVCMEKMTPCMQRCSMCSAYLETCACAAATTVVACMSCLRMSDTRAVNPSHWGCMSSAAVHVPFFVGNSAWACCAGNEKRNEGVEKKEAVFRTPAGCAALKGACLGVRFSDPFFPRALGRGTEMRPSPVAFPAEDARRL